MVACLTDFVAVSPFQARCYIKTGRARSAWELYLQFQGSEMEQSTALQVMLRSHFLFDSPVVSVVFQIQYN